MISWLRRRSSEDASLAELLMLPVVMAGLSLLMWFSLPTFPEAFAAFGSRIDERRDAIARLGAQAADLLPAESSRCIAVVDPPPVFIERDQTTNMEILGPSRLRELGIDVAIPDDVDLGLTGDLFYLMYWRQSPPIQNRRMTRKRIANEFERPLSYRYVLFYGDEVTRDRIRVSAVLFDLSTGNRLCELTFDEADSQARERLLQELAAIARAS